MSGPVFYSLSTITKRIQEILQPAIGKTFWVRAEIASGRERGGSFYCELVETNDQGQIVAQMRCTIWSRDLGCIRRKFNECNLTLNLDDGALVGFQCSLQFNAKFGLSLCVCDADPALALGALEIKKKQIINQLQKEGLFDENKTLIVPTLPLRIGLVTSANSAAYNDFVKTLALSGFGFKVYLADAVVQGEKAQDSVLKALSTLEVINLDLIVLIRGGGSKTDLFYLDNELIARKIAHHKYPVWTGIGHEVDTSVLDYVANRAFKTPTAVAEELVARFKETAAHLEEARNRLQTTWDYRLQQAVRHLRDAEVGMRQGTRKLLHTNTVVLGGRASQLSSRVTERLSGEKARLAVSGKTLAQSSVATIQQCRFLNQESGRRLQSLSRRMLHQQFLYLGALINRFRMERFLRYVSLQETSIQNTKNRMRQTLDQRLAAWKREQVNFRKRFQVSSVLKRIEAEQSTLEAKLTAAMEQFLRYVNLKETSLKTTGTRMRAILDQRMGALKLEQVNFRKRFQVGPVLKRIEAEQNTLDAKLAAVKAYDPQNSLKRGFALLYDHKDRLIKSVRDAKTGQLTYTKLYDGRVVSTVEKVEGK